MERWVDFWAKGFKEWRRVALDSLEEAVNAVPPEDVFFSPHIYQGRVPKDGEAAAGPLYVDLDGDMETALGDAQRVATYFGTLVGAENVRCFFSGKKGAHVYVSGYALGVRPDPDYAQIMKMGVELMVAQTGVTTVDMAVYSKRRLMRCPGTIHGGTGKRCAPIIDGRIANIESPSAALRIFSPSDTVMGWFSQMREVYLAAQAGSRHALEVELKKGVMPDCVAHILDEGLWMSGTRNAVSVQLSLALKAMGYKRSQAMEVARKWASALPERYTTTRSREAVRAAEANVSWAYSHPSSRFLCEIGMRTCGARCPGRDQCAAIAGVKNEDKPSLVSLEEAVTPNLLGQPMSFRATPVAVDNLPYLLPMRFQMTCSPMPKAPCEDCRNNSGKGEIFFKSHDLLRLSALADERMMLGYARSAMGIPKNCPGHKLHPSAHENMVMGFVQPYYNGSVVENAETVRENQVYVRAAQLDDQVPYEMTGQTYMHPRSKRAVHVIERAEPLQKAHENLVLTPQQVADLEIFQADDNLLSLESRVNDIQIDWERHVHRIYGRRVHATMMSALWFSPIAFPFLGKTEPRGWLDILVIGDTAQGKSEMARAFLDFFNFGTLINGENASFAGLVAGVDTIEGRKVARKGALPRADGSILVVDEFGGMDPKTIAMMSQARSEGIAGMSKIIHRTFPCRTGKMWIANPVDPQTRVSVNMDDAPYPIIHAMNMFPNPEDLRRCDGVIGFRRMAETTKLIHAIDTVMSEPVYTPRLSQLLQRWAISRPSTHVIYTKAGEEACVELGRELSERYSETVSLFVPGDSRQKVARWAKAFAGMTFSTDDEGKRLVVKPAHAEFAHKVLTHMCDGPDLQFNLFTAQDAEGPNIDWASFADLTIRFPALCGGDNMTQGEPSWRAVVRVMLNGKPFSSRDLLEMTDINDPKVLFRKLMREGMIKKHTMNSYRTTTRGVKTFKLFVSWIVESEGRPLAEIKKDWFEQRLPRL